MGEPQITIVPVAEVPRKRNNRVSRVAPIVRLVMNLEPGDSLRVAARSLGEAKRLGSNVAKLVRDRGLACRYRTVPDAVFFVTNRTTKAPRGSR